MKSTKTSTKPVLTDAVRLEGGYMPMMKRTEQFKTAPKSKKIILFVLFATSAMVAAAGIVLTAVSIINSTSFTVFQSQIPGSVLGLIVIFLGARYFMSVLKLKPELLKSENQFSWSNFRKESHT
jgi:hypothetical protein